MDVQSTELALLSTESGLVVSHLIPEAPSPALVYLSRLTSAASRRTMAGHLERIVSMIAPEVRGTDVRGANVRKAFESLPWHRLSYIHTQAIRSALAGGDLAPATANTALAALRGVLQESWRLGLMDAEQYRRAADLAPIRGDRLPAGRALGADELAALLRVCREDRTAAGLRDAALLSVLYLCGLRRSEVVGLDVSDWDAREGSLRVRRGKGGKQRLAYIGDSVALEAWLGRFASKQDGPLFRPISRAGRVLDRRLSAAGVYAILQQRAAAAGVADVSPHDMRRTFAGDLLDAGVDLSTVQKMMGHASPTTSARYDRRGDEARRTAAGRLKMG